MVWLKKLLSSNPPAWTTFAHELLRKFAAPSPTSKPNVRNNYFLQSWPISPSKLPPPISRCITLAKKYNLMLDALFFHPNVLESLPIWFHTGALPSLKKLNNYFYAQCIRDHHGVTTTGEMWTLAHTPLGNPHRRLSTCTCPQCNELRETAGCLKPFKCVETASNIIKCIPNKWTPNPAPPRTNPDLSAEEIARNRVALERKEALTFHPALTEAGPIENAFRILCPPTPRTQSPATQYNAPNAITHPTVEILYGSNHRIDDDGTQISSGSAFFKKDDPRNFALCTKSESATNDTGILCAILESIRRIDHFVPLPEMRTKTGSTVVTRTYIGP